MAYQFGIADMNYGGEAIGCLQGVSIDFSFSTAMLHCGNSLYASDIRTHSGEITGSAEFADLNAVAFTKLLGGTRTGDTVALTQTSKPTVFEMVITLITDGITFTVTFPKVRTTKLSWAYVRDGHVIPSFDFVIEADTDGSVATIDLGDVS